MDTGTIVLLVFFFVVLLVGGFFGYRYFVPATPTDPNAIKKNYGILAGLGGFGTMFMVYLPTALLSFGFISDMLAQQYNMSAGSLVGISGILLNWALGKAMGVKSEGPVFGPEISPTPSPPSQADPLSDAADAIAQGSTAAVANLTNLNPDAPDLPPPPPFEEGGRKKQRGGAIELKDICNIPGLGLNGYFPQSVLMTATILMFYLNGIWANNPSHSIFASSFTVLFILLQSYFVYSKCSSQFTMYKIGGGIVVGLILGTVGYWINQAIFPSTTPGSVGPSSPLYGGSGKPGVGTCSAPNDQDQFVCEAYKNGELISSTITS